MTVRVLRALFLISLVLPWPASAISQTATDQRIFDQMGTEAFYRADFERAVLFYERLLRELGKKSRSKYDSRLGTVLLFLSEAYQRQNRCEDALSVFKQRLRVEEDLARKKEEELSALQEEVEDFLRRLAVKQAPNSRK